MGTPTPGPGKFSQRTDKAVGEANRNLPNADYGEQAQYQSDQQGLKSHAPSAPAPAGASFNDLFGNPAANAIPLTQGTAQPDTPVTDGAALGPGAGTEVLNQPSDDSTEKLKPYMLALQYMADQPGSSTAARNLVRQLGAT